MHCRIVVFVLRVMQDGKWAAENVIQVPGKKVDNWALPVMPG